MGASVRHSSSTSPPARSWPLRDGPPSHTTTPRRVRRSGPARREVDPAGARLVTSATLGERGPGRPVHSVVVTTSGRTSASVKSAQPGSRSRLEVTIGQPRGPRSWPRARRSARRARRWARGPVALRPTVPAAARITSATARMFGKTRRSGAPPSGPDRPSIAVPPSPSPPCSRAPRVAPAGAGRAASADPVDRHVGEELGQQHPHGPGPYRRGTIRI